MHLLALVVTLGLLKPGAVVADFTVRDPDDKAVKFTSLCSGHATLVFYEDKEGGEQNERFKQRLGQLRAKSAAARKVALVAVADVAPYDYWPAKGFVKSALRDAGKKGGITVWADWSGAGRANLSASTGRSNVIMLDVTGSVVWASVGRLSPAQEDDLLNRVAKLGG